MKKNYKIVLLCIIYLVASVFHPASPKKIAQSRDPFYSEEKKAPHQSKVKNKQTRQRSKFFFLEGVMRTRNNLAAVVSDGQESAVVTIGDHIGDYKVEIIDHNTVVLIHGKKTKKLELD